MSGVIEMLMIENTSEETLYEEKYNVTMMPREKRDFPRVVAQRILVNYPAKTKMHIPDNIARGDEPKKPVTAKEISEPEVETAEEKKDGKPETFLEFRSRMLKEGIPAGEISEAWKEYKGLQAFKE